MPSLPWFCAVVHFLLQETPDVSSGGFDSVWFGQMAGPNQQGIKTTGEPSGSTVTKVGTWGAWSP
eukprot:JP448854.1.p2 GENE.JP448854.1~~JP448854.1.p2  ORF type:complete len:65 (+),score=18.93 JP448854.1:58-252(+)